MLNLINQTLILLCIFSLFQLLAHLFWPCQWAPTRLSPRLASPPHLRSAHLTSPPPRPFAFPHIPFRLALPRLSPCPPRLVSSRLASPRLASVYLPCLAASPCPTSPLPRLASPHLPLALPRPCLTPLVSSSCLSSRLVSFRLFLFLFVCSTSPPSGNQVDGLPPAPVCQNEHVFADCFFTFAITTH